MYSQQELDDAVAAGAISAEAAASLRGYFETQRSTAIPDEEQFRLITGFNDIFVSIAAAILLFAVGWIGQSLGASLGLIIDSDGPSPLAPAANDPMLSGVTSDRTPAAWLGSTMTGRWVRSRTRATALRSRVCRVARSNVLIPLSQSTTLGFPSASTYSAAISGVSERRQGSRQGFSTLRRP